MFSPDEFDQYSLESVSGRFAGWGFRLCGALSVYAVLKLLDTLETSFEQLFDELMEFGAYDQSRGGWLQPIQADYMRERCGLVALSISPERNTDSRVEEAILSMQASKRLPDDIDAEEVAFYRSVGYGFRTMKDIISWLPAHPEWVIIASVNEGYGGLDARHQLTIYSADEELRVIDSAGVQSGKGITYHYDNDCESHLTGHCILVKRR